MALEQASIEDRVREIEDRLAIYNLIASHPPAADTGSAAYTTSSFTEDGVIDLAANKTAIGNKAIGQVQGTPGHKAAIAGGLAHFAGLPRVDVCGDTATATSYLQILTPHPSADPVEVPNHGSSRGFRVHRVGVNRWELVRTPEGWKIKRRTLRSLDGTEPALELLRRALPST